jgi:hypothetical protein
MVMVISFQAAAFYVKHGIAVTDTAENFINLTSERKDYSTLCKETCAYMRKEYDKLRKRFDTLRTNILLFSIHN